METARAMIQTRSLSAMFNIEVQALRIMKMVPFCDHDGFLKKYGAFMVMYSSDSQYFYILGVQ